MLKKITDMPLASLESEVYLLEYSLIIVIHFCKGAAVISLPDDNSGCTVKHFIEKSITLLSQLNQG